MPDTNIDLCGSDEDPSFDPVGEAPADPEAELPPAVDGNGLESARQLQRWLNGPGPGPSDRGVIWQARNAWGALRRTPGALEVARAKGYFQFACRTHRQIHCRDCACPICGAPGGCSCNARRVDPNHRGSPRLVRPVSGVRRVGYELEVMVDSSTTLQRALGEYPFGYHDGSLHADGWYRGVEFKISTYGTERGRRFASDIVDRIHGVGGVGAPRCCGHHVHVERSPNDIGDRIAARWMEIQQDLYRLFPTRRGNCYCEPVEQASRYALSGHYTVLNATPKGTWEIRIHPGTVSWIVSAAWSAWCLGFITEEESPLGQAYLNARRAALAVSNGSTAHPWVWRRAIERFHRANGSDHARTLRAVADGLFRRYESEESLRSYLAERSAANAPTNAGASQ